MIKFYVISLVSYTKLTSWFNNNKLHQNNKYLHAIKTNLYFILIWVEQILSGIIYTVLSSTYILLYKR